MKLFKKPWQAGVVAIALLIVLPVWFFANSPESVGDTPWEGMPRRPAHVDHKDLMEGPFVSGQEVTIACLSCHEEAGEQVLHAT